MGGGGQRGSFMLNPGQLTGGLDQADRLLPRGGVQRVGPQRAVPGCSASQPIRARTRSEAGMETATPSNSPAKRPHSHNCSMESA